MPEWLRGSFIVSDSFDTESSSIYFVMISMARRHASEHSFVRYGSWTRDSETIIGHFLAGVFSIFSISKFVAGVCLVV